MSSSEVNTIKEVEFSDFLKLDIRVARVLTVVKNRKARHPAYVMKLDFGDVLGVKTTSAQLTDNYKVDDLVGSQVLAIINFPIKRVAGVKSEVLVLAAVDLELGNVVLTVERPVKAGTRVL